MCTAGGIPRITPDCWGPAACLAGRFLVFGGSDGSHPDSLRDRHSGFHRDILEFDPELCAGRIAGEMPAPLGTTGMTVWQDRLVVAGSEDRPGSRSKQVLAARVRLRSGAR